MEAFIIIIPTIWSLCFIVSPNCPSPNVYMLAVYNINDENFSQRLNIKRILLDILSIALISQGSLFCQLSILLYIKLYTY